MKNIKKRVWKAKWSRGDVIQNKGTEYCRVILDITDDCYVFLEYNVIGEKKFFINPTKGVLRIPDMDKKFEKVGVINDYESMRSTFMQITMEYNKVKERADILLSRYKIIYD